MSLFHTIVKFQRWYAQWYETDPGRLLIEKEAMSNRFPHFVLRKIDEKLAWLGSLETNHRNRYEILLVYPADFPRSAPLVYPINPAIEVWDDRTSRTRHQYPDGHLCLYYPGDRTFHQDTTAATVVAVTAAWLFAYEYWLNSGKREWPGIEYD